MLVVLKRSRHELARVVDREATDQLARRRLDPFARKRARVEEIEPAADVSRGLGDEVGIKDRNFVHVSRERLEEVDIDLERLRIKSTFGSRLELADHEFGSYSLSPGEHRIEKANEVMCHAVLLDFIDVQKCERTVVIGHGSAVLRERECLLTEPTPRNSLGCSGILGSDRVHIIVECIKEKITFHKTPENAGVAPF